MDLKRALRVLKIEELLEQRKKETTQLFIKGLIENGNIINDAIMTVKEFLDEPR